MRLIKHANRGLHDAEVIKHILDGDKWPAGWS
jgi:hypothetical protein